MSKRKKLKVDDLLGPSKKRKKQKVDDLLGPKKRRGARAYKPLPVPKVPEAGGIFAAREEKGTALGRTCLNPECKKELKYTRGRPPIICGKHACFRWYRNAYRHDYDKVRAA